MPDDLSSRSERFDLLYRISQIFNSTLEMDEVLNRVMDEVVQTTRAERGFIVSRDEKGGLVFRVARGIDHQNLVNDPSQVSGSIINEVLDHGQPVLTHEATSDHRFSARTSVLDLRLKSILCVPLQCKHNPPCVIYVENRIQKGIFEEKDLELLAAIASSAAIAIDNARLYQDAVDKGRMEREMQMALTVQKGLLPSELPGLHGWEFAAHWQPARQVSGDFYDFITLGSDRTRSPDSLGLVIADVTDKGMPAALFMVHTRSILRSTLHQVEEPKEAITRANRLICMESNHGLFVTMFYAQLNPQTGELRYVNAGHNPPLHYQAATHTLTRLMPTGIPLGVVEEFQYQGGRTHLERGDFLFCYTDGITEPINSQGDEFGLARLEEIILRNRHTRPARLAEIVDQAVDAFTSTSERFDDKTIVIVKKMPLKIAAEN